MGEPDAAGLLGLERLELREIRFKEPVFAGIGEDVSQVLKA